MKSTITNQRKLDHFIVRGNERSSFHSNSRDPIEIIELMSDNDTDDDDDVIDVWGGESSSITNSDKLNISHKPQNHIQSPKSTIREPLAFIAKTTTKTTTTTTTTITTKTIALINQPNLNLNTNDNKVPDTNQSSFLMESSNRSDTNIDTQKCHNEVLDEQQGPTIQIQKQQNQKENEENLPIVQRPCRKRCTPQEAVELSDLRLRLELQSGYKPSMEEVEEQYQQLKKTEKENNKDGKTIHTTKKRCTMDDNSNNRQKNSQKTKDECSNNGILANITSSSTRDNNNSPAKCDYLNKLNSVWENKYEILVEYINQRRSKEGSSTIPWIWDGNVPARFITNDGIKLGWWIIKQRRAKHNGTLNPKREQRLLSIGLKWGCCRNFKNSSKQQEQHHEINDSKWNSKTRTKTNGNNQLEVSDSSARDNNSSRVKCDAFNKVDSLWENKYEILIEYINQRRSKEGSSNIPWIWDGNVPQRFITNDGIRLGKWIDKERTAKQNGTLNPAREQLLTRIGLKWICSRKSMPSSKQKEQQHGRNDSEWNSKTTKSNGSNQMEASDNKTSSSKKHENVSKSKEKFEEEKCMIHHESISLKNSTATDMKHDVSSDTKYNSSTTSKFLEKKNKKTKIKQDSIMNSTNQQEELKSKKLYEQSEQLYIHGMRYFQRGKYYSSSIEFSNSGNIIKLLILKTIHNRYKHEKIMNNENYSSDINFSIHKNIVNNDDDNNNDGSRRYNNLNNLVEKYAQSFYRKAICCYHDKKYLQAITACNKILVTNADIVPRPLSSSSPSQSHQNTTITKMECDEELPNDVLKMIPKSIQADALCQRAKTNILINFPRWKTDDDFDDEIDNDVADENESVDCFDNLNSHIIFQSIINHRNDCVSILQDMEAAASLGNNDAILWCNQFNSFITEMISKK